MNKNDYEKALDKACAKLALYDVILKVLYEEKNIILDTKDKEEWKLWCMPDDEGVIPCKDCIYCKKAITSNLTYCTRQSHLINISWYNTCDYAERGDK